MLTGYTMHLRKCLIVALILALFISCKNSPDDSAIGENIAELVAGNKNYSEVRADVDKGKVSLSGTCYGDGCVAEIERTVSKMDGVKQVVNELTVSTTDLTLRTSVQSIISKYAGVQADIVAGEVVLRGSISRSLLEPLMTELQGLDARKIDNQLVINQ